MVHNSSWERGGRKCERNSTADTKVSKEEWAGTRLLNKKTRKRYLVF